MRLPFLFLFVFLLLTQNLWAQTDTADTGEEEEIIPWSKPNDEDRTRLGIVMGAQGATLRGNTIPNNKMMFGLLGGGFLRLKLYKWLWAQQQLQISFRGSNFGNGAGEISSIRMLCLDLPLYFLIRPVKNSSQKFGAGVYYSTLLSSDLYIDKLTYPVGPSPALDRNDWGIGLVYQYQMEYIAIQLALKSGLRDLNLGRPWPGNAKPLNNGGSIYYSGLELNLIF